MAAQGGGEDWNKQSSDVFLFGLLNPSLKAQQMTDQEPPPPRFLVRRGFKGWMFFDRPGIGRD